MEPDLLKPINILLVDDDEDDYFIIQKIFNKIESSPFVLEWTSSFSKAVKLIEAHQHDLYLIDYRLGERTGLDLLELALPQERSEPFILLTGRGDRDIEQRSMKLAASDYLVKGSFDADMLSRTLHYALQRKQIEEQRLQQMIELNRSKDEFISIASHQLRTPATGVKQYVGMLLEGFFGDLPAAQKQLLEKAYESNERQLRIVSDLLKVARVDAGKVMLQKKPTGLNALITDVLREQQLVYDKRDQTITFIPTTPDLTVFADRDSLRMVLENLIDNASKYSEEGTHVIITTRQVDNEVHISVADQGVGINPDATSRLFEKFSRLDNPLSTKVGGTGLGLYWAKKIIEHHDGTILHQPNGQNGTIFTVCLPKTL